MTTCPIVARLQAQEREAEARLGGNPPPDAPYALGWHTEPPAAAGTYRWRLNSQWEEIEREVDPYGKTYSHRFLQPVLAVRVGGEWFY